ncbi:MAG: DMT family transporter [Proteobacteria bacterium]|nr:DMT family transporter [Pseudomonadota bacterium]MBS0572821.1 DMT family transporter [Pseudomonadota bacterium]
MLLAGIGIPILAVLNSQLGARSGAPVAAGVVLFLVALAATAAALLISGQGGTMTRLAGQPWYLFLGGLFVAFYVLSVTWVAPRFGVGNAIFCVLLGQMVAASVIDQFGLFGAVQRPIDLSRGLGIAAMTLGLALIQRG